MLMIQEPPGPFNCEISGSGHFWGLKSGLCEHTIAGPSLMRSSHLLGSIDMTKPGLGTVKLTGRTSVVVGSDATFKLTYTAGAAGIDDRGTVRVAFRDMTDGGELQWTDPKAPNYVTAVTTADARVVLNDRTDIRPWREGITVKVLDGFLREGEKIIITFGDRSKGSPGWSMQTFCEETFEFRVLVNRYSTKVYEEMTDCPTVRIVAAKPVRLVAIAPTVVRTGQAFEVGLKTEDVYGNPTARARRVKQKAFKRPGVYALPFRDKKTGLVCETNPIVVEDKVERGCFWADFHAQSEETIGTNSVEEYFAFARDKALIDIASHQGNDIQITDTFWKRLNRTTKTFNEPGRFVTFPGYEWSGNTAVGGDRNVIFKSEGNPIHRSSIALVPTDEARDPCAPTADVLFRRMKGRECLVFAHVGGRFADLDRHKEGMEVAVEIHSCWGTQEWLLADAFERGYRVGVVANSDGHKGRPGAEYPGTSHFGNRGGLTCVLAKKLDRRSVWEALKRRHFYATTGARIFLDVRTDAGAMMGDLVNASSRPEFLIRAVGAGPIERIELRNGTDVVKTFRPYAPKDVGRRVKVMWGGSERRGRERNAGWDGGLCVKGTRILGFTPVNFDNPMHFCERSGANALRWHSVTTGGWAGVILELDDTRGTVEIRTEQKSITVPVKALTARGKTRKAGGVDLKLHVCRLPDENGVRGMTLDPFRPARLKRGDNPFHVHVVQEDGHRAWSSPITVVRK